MQRLCDVYVAVGVFVVIQPFMHCMPVFIRGYLLYFLIIGRVVKVREKACHTFTSAYLTSNMVFAYCT